MDKYSLFEVMAAESEVPGYPRDDKKWFPSPEEQELIDILNQRMLDKYPPPYDLTKPQAWTDSFQNYIDYHKENGLWDKKEAHRIVAAAAQLVKKTSIDYDDGPYWAMGWDDDDDDDPEDLPPWSSDYKKRHQGK